MAEGFGEVHGGQAWEDNEAGNEEGAEHFHTDDDSERAKNGENDVIEFNLDANGAGEVLIESDGEDLATEEQESGYDDDAKDDTED